MDKRRRSIYGICRRIMVGVLTLSFLWQASSDVMVAAAQEDTARELYVVYDNSGSMAGSGGATDAWCQAAYAIETLAALMDGSDRMYLYVMCSDGNYYDKYSFPETERTSAENIREDVHEVLLGLEYTGYTHKDGLMQAVADIRASSGTNKQLLIFSDDEFNYQGGKSNKEAIDLSAMGLGDVKKIYYKMADNDDNGNAENNGVSGVDVTFTSGNSGDGILKTFTNISNLIYDRQEVDYTRSGTQLTFTLGLPVKRLIVIAQSSEREISEEEISLTAGTAVSAGMTYRSLKKTEAKVGSYGEKALECGYYAAVKIYEKASLMPMGSYTAQVPDDSTVAVYAEYEEQYTVVLTGGEDGGEWNLDKISGGEDPIREGEYHAEVRFVNALNGEIIEDSPLYDKLEQKLTMDRDGEQAQITAGESFFLEEGDCTIEGTATLEGNYPREISYAFSVRHQLGKLQAEADIPAAGFDLDRIKSGNARFQVRLLEDGGNISDYETLEFTAEVMEAASGKTEEEQKEKEEKTSRYYVCNVEEEQGKWMGTLSFVQDVKMEESMLQECILKLTASGVKDGQQISCTEEFPLTFYAAPQEISLEPDTAPAGDALELFWNNKLTLTPTINGETIDAGQWVEQIEYQADGAGGEDMPKLTISRNGRNPLTFSLRLARGIAFWNLRDGGSVSGTVTLNMMRYGQNCSGSYSFEIELEPMSWQRKLIVIAGVTVLGYIAWLIFGKWLLGCRFWLVPIRASYTVRYGRRILTGQIVPVRWRIRFLGRPFSSAVSIPLKNLSFLDISERMPDKLVIRRKAGNRFVIANIRDLVKNDVIYKDGRPLKEEDRFWNHKNGLELTLAGKYPVELNIYMEEM